MLNEEYNKRLADVEAYFQVLAYIDHVDTYRSGQHIKNLLDNSQLKLTSGMQQCMRANAIIMLYSLVESTFCNCIFYIYDKIHDCNLIYEDLSDYMRHIWISLQFKDGLSTKHIRERAKSISDKLAHENVVYADIPKGTSGNLDMKEICNICKKFGICLGRVHNRSDVENTLAFLKLYRNHLAHGNDTFSSVGSIVTLSDLLTHKNNTISFLQQLITLFTNYVADEKYKR